MVVGVNIGHQIYVLVVGKGVPHSNSVRLALDWLHPFMYKKYEFPFIRIDQISNNKLCRLPKDSMKVIVSVQRKGHIFRGYESQRVHGRWKHTCAVSRLPIKGKWSLDDGLWTKASSGKITEHGWLLRMLHPESAPNPNSSVNLTIFNLAILVVYLSCPPQFNPYYCLPRPQTHSSFLPPIDPTLHHSNLEPAIALLWTLLSARASAQYAAQPYPRPRDLNRLTSHAHAGNTHHTATCLNLCLSPFSLWPP